MKVRAFGEPVLAPGLARARSLASYSAAAEDDPEIKVLWQVSVGFTDKEIASTPASPRRPWSHLVHIFIKLDVDSHSLAVHLVLETRIRWHRIIWNNP
ncbi:hypothetical protein E5720_20700 [Rhodococcus sp. PAMC28707]|uniref:hypothetical protein n=1 Tax=unclassified Rhodococcus (in: high G+C Gram-positive bacteria) TaxID=192944 RepID=UPI00109DE593|nr:MULTISPECIES: hypothetical protein [unclassified Rhodococcus (in: high G+C Gram-positive bacteria)]QCB51301.1 hypothetical protein E5769_14825 [Rhodococcus sp. PAMC28705]QCB60531.1 hypothetical protein E5720_20700 [Rhodococcus sp. PAMC28707]